MARDSKEQKAIKIEALWEAIVILKDESTSTINQLTSEKVVSIAHELYGDKLKTKISLTSIKKPSSEEYEAIKDEIDKYRNEHKKIKKVAQKKTILEVTKLKQQVENLVSEIAKFYDYKLQLKERLEAKENTISKLKVHVDNLNKEIDRLRAN